MLDFGVDAGIRLWGGALKGWNEFILHVRKV